MHNNISSKLLAFDDLIHQIKVLKQSSKKNTWNKNIISRVSFNEKINEFKKLKSEVYELRLAETKKYILSNKEAFSISPFELMEHNFRENTHSNIWKYLFDYNFSGDNATNTLCELIKQAKKNNSGKIEENLLKKKYSITREFFVGNGRIDLLIKDETNKFVIVIENKVLANISSKKFEDDIENTIIKSQLDLYREYFNRSKFQNWEKIFFLISYKNIDNFEDTNFEFLDYKTLYTILKKVQTSDNIWKEYLTLLHCLTNRIYDKHWLIIESRKIINNEKNINLNIFETIKYFINAK